MREANAVSPTVVYLPIGRDTFDMDAAGDVFARSVEYLQTLEAHLFVPEGAITSLEELTAVLEQFSVKPDLVVLQFATFVDATFASKVAEVYDAPFLVWSVLEPETGARLRLNSLTGGNSTSHYLRDAGHPYTFVYGDPEDTSAREPIERQIRVRRLIKELSGLTVGVVGAHPPGFFFSATDEADLRQKLGVQVHEMDLQRVIQEAGEVSPDEWRPLVEELSEKVAEVNTDDEAVGKFARLAVHLRQYSQENGIGAMAIKNWPEFFNVYEAAADASMSLLSDTGMPTANESDIHGAITMYIQQQLTGSSAYLGDLAYMDETENSFTFWHDGAGAPSLANSQAGARAGTHPNRGIALTLEVGLKPGLVTIARVGHSRGRFRLLVLRGEVLDVAQRFYGTSAVIRPEGSAFKILSSLMEEGWEPHYSMVYGDCAADLEELGKQLAVDVYSYVR